MHEVCAYLTVKEAGEREREIEREREREREREGESKLVFYAQSTSAVISGRREADRQTEKEFLNR